MYLVNVQLALDVLSEAEAYDAVNEILRGQQRSWVETSCLMDYAVGGLKEFEADPETYEEGQAPFAVP